MWVGNRTRESRGGQGGHLVWTWLLEFSSDPLIRLSACQGTREVAVAGPSLSGYPKTEIAWITREKTNEART